MLSDCEAFGELEVRFYFGEDACEEGRRGEDCKGKVVGEVGWSNC